jgi:hypothetical protein
LTLTCTSPNLQKMLPRFDISDECCSSMMTLTGSLQNAASGENSSITIHGISCVLREVASLLDVHEGDDGPRWSE